MVAALIVRRKQLVERGFSDPFGMTPGPLSITPLGNGTLTPATNGTASGMGTVCLNYLISCNARLKSIALSQLLPLR